MGGEKGGNNRDLLLPAAAASSSSVWQQPKHTMASIPFSSTATTTTVLRRASRSSSPSVSGVSSVLPSASSSSPSFVWHYLAGAAADSNNDQRQQRVKPQTQPPRFCYDEEDSYPSSSSKKNLSLAPSLTVSAKVDSKPASFKTAVSTTTSSFSTSQQAAFATMLLEPHLLKHNSTATVNQQHLPPSSVSSFSLSASGPLRQQKRYHRCETGHQSKLLRRRKVASQKLPLASSSLSSFSAAVTSSHSSSRHQKRKITKRNVQAEQVRGLESNKRRKIIHNMKIDRVNRKKEEEEEDEEEQNGVFIFTRFIKEAHQTPTKNNLETTTKVKAEVTTKAENENEVLVECYNAYLSGLHSFLPLVDDNLNNTIKAEGETLLHIWNTFRSSFEVKKKNTPTFTAFSSSSSSYSPQQMQELMVLVALAIGGATIATGRQVARQLSALVKAHFSLSCSHLPLSQDQCKIGMGLAYFALEDGDMMSASHYAELVVRSFFEICDRQHQPQAHNSADYSLLLKALYTILCCREQHESSSSSSSALCLSWQQLRDWYDVAKESIERRNRSLINTQAQTMEEALSKAMDKCFMLMFESKYTLLCLSQIGCGENSQCSNAATKLKLALMQLHTQYEIFASQLPISSSSFVQNDNSIHQKQQPALLIAQHLLSTFPISYSSSSSSFASISSVEQMLTLVPLALSAQCCHVLGMQKKALELALSFLNAALNFVSSSLCWGDYWTRETCLRPILEIFEGSSARLGQLEQHQVELLQEFGLLARQQQLPHQPQEGSTIFANNDV